ncbi:MAG: PIN domain-containing protein [Chloroflexota bacterium]
MRRGAGCTHRIQSHSFALCATRRRCAHLHEASDSVHPLLSGHRTLGLDSNVLIYRLEDAGALVQAAANLVDGAAGGQLEAVFSAVGPVEVLTGPARAGDGSLFEMAADTLRDLRIRVVPLDGPGAEDAACLRSSTALGLEDAVHLACARSAGATAFVTNDRRIRSTERLAVIGLADLAPADPESAGAV